MDITFYGHACFGLVAPNGDKLLFDTFISGNELAKDINIDEIDADYILISHGHEDHVLDAESIARRTGAKIISSYEIVMWYANTKGYENGHPMNIGGAFDFDFGRVHYVAAVHSSTLPDGANGGPAGGFVIELKDGQTFYYSGDTALTYDMKLLAEKFDLDFAMLCIGDNFTMGIEDGVRAAQFVDTKKVIGMHFDTFGWIEIDHGAARNAFTAQNIELILPEIGETLTV